MRPGVVQSGNDQQAVNRNGCPINVTVCAETNRNDPNMIMCGSETIDFGSEKYQHIKVVCFVNHDQRFAETGMCYLLGRDLSGRIACWLIVVCGLHCCLMCSGLHCTVA